MKGRIFHLGLLLGLAVTTAQAQLTFRYFYDGNSQLFRVLDSTGNLVEYIYDLTGNPTQINRSVIPGDALSILNFVPQRGTAGQTVTIYGQNFGSTPGANLVKFNGTVATVTSASATVLVVQAPNGVTTGPVTVTVNGATVSSGSLIFTVPPHCCAN